MSRPLPGWARDQEGVRLVREGEDPGGAAEAYHRRLTEEIARERLQSRGTAHLPANREQARIEITEEQRARYASRPRTRRWRALEKIDENIDALTQRHAEAIAKLQEAEGNVRQAPEQDARSLAAWVAGGEKGKRPEATLPEREWEHDATRLLVEAVAVELDSALEERRRHVERHRGRMIEEARRDVAEARDRLLAQVRGLAELRDALLAARETLAWAAVFPEPAEGYGFPSALALGLLKPVQETLQTSARIEYRNLVAALEADAEALAARFADDVKRGLGEAGPRTPLKEAMWEDDPELVAWKKQELERARELAQVRDPARLAQEVRW